MSVEFLCIFCEKLMRWKFRWCYEWKKQMNEFQEPNLGGWNSCLKCIKTLAFNQSERNAFCSWNETLKDKQTGRMKKKQLTGNVQGYQFIILNKKYTIFKIQLRSNNDAFQTTLTSLRYWSLIQNNINSGHFETYFWTTILKK